jgi:proteasome accessory factor B
LHVVDDHQKVRTVSRKSERLVNLVIALLATKRYITKSEIFRTIEGYEGSNESMERMFERDKDELRTLGIEIEVSGLDPLFDDEVGYREMDKDGFSPNEIAYMSLAAQLWKDASLSDVSQKAIRKLSAVSVPADISEIPAFAPVILTAPTFLSELISAIADRRVVQFKYLDAEMIVNVRKVHVYSYFSLKGFWYFSGLDVDKSQNRTFRSDRVMGDLTVSKKTDCYEIPVDYKTDLSFKENSSLSEVHLHVRTGRGSQLRILASTIETGEEFDIIKVSYSSKEEMIALILWHLDDVVVVSPEPLKRSVIDALNQLVEVHG